MFEFYEKFKNCYLRNRSPFGKYLKGIILLPLIIPTMSFSQINQVPSDQFQLEQVIIFSRHGLRAPITSPSSSLGKMTPNQWPESEDTPSYLTLRGGVLETYFGHFFNQWFKKQGLLKAEECPGPYDVKIYANSMQRTIATAQFWALGAFPACEVDIFHRYRMNTMDELFSLNINSDDPDYLASIKQSIIDHAGTNGIEGISERLKPQLIKLQDILEYKESLNCLEGKLCDFFEEPISVNVITGKEPNVKAPFRLGTAIVDAFLLEYYEGKPIEEIAWGKIKSLEELQELVSIKEEYMNLVFKSPLVAKHVTQNLLRYINETLGNPNSPKITLLVGHDSNIASLLAVFGIEEHNLPEQIEISPIGSKIVVQKWRHIETNEEFIRVDLMYQSSNQIANQAPLSLDNPPMMKNLAVRNCTPDENGLCSYAEFLTQLKGLSH